MDANANPSPFETFTPEPEGEGIDLRHYWHVVWRNKLVILGLAALLTLIVYLWVNTLPHVYQATSKIMLIPRVDRSLPIEPSLSYDPGLRGSYIPTQLNLLQSRELARKVVEKLDLASHPAIANAQPAAPILDWRSYLPQWLQLNEGRSDNDADSEENKTVEAADAIVEGLQVKRQGRSQLISISYDSTDPRFAAVVTNGVARTFIEDDLESRLDSTRQANAWITERLEELRQNLVASEQTLQDYRERAGLVVTSDGDWDRTQGSRLESSQLGEVSARMVEARQARVRAETILQQVRAIDAGDYGRLESIPAILSHPVVQEYRGAEARAESELSLLSKRYGPMHPKMVEAQAQLDSARQRTREQIRKVVSGIEKEYEVAVANERALERELGSARDAVQDVNRKKNQLRVLEREVASNRELYNLFLANSKERGVTVDVQKPVARVVGEAIVPREPYKPDKRKFLLAGLLGGLFLGVGLALLLDFLDSTFKGGDEVERRLGLPVLGMLPLVGRKRLKSVEKTAGPHAGRLFIDDPKSNFSEAVRTIRTGVMLSGLDNPHKVIAVTSFMLGEGKTTVSLNLAMALSQMGRVVLIDADMRRPSVGKTLDVPDGTTGLSSLVAGTAKAAECVRETGVENLWVVTSGIVPPNPLELLSSKRFADVLNALADKFDRVVIDTAPTQAVSDSLVVSREAGVVIYVVKTDDTPYHAAQQGIKRLRRFDAPLLGVVLNHVDMSKSSRYYGKYSYYKNSYYGDYGYGTQG